MSEPAAVSSSVRADDVPESSVPGSAAIARLQQRSIWVTLSLTSGRGSANGPWTPEQRSTGMTNLHELKAPTDICVLVADIDRSIAFYTEKLGFRLRRRAEGFADFHTDGVTLALWDMSHMRAHTGAGGPAAPGRSKACVAVELGAPEAVDNLYNELVAKGVSFIDTPTDYPWNARCCYFSDPDDTIWELYAWREGGPGDYHDVNPAQS